VTSRPPQITEPVHYGQQCPGKRINYAGNDTPRIRQQSLLGREVPAGPDRPAVAGVQRFNGIGRTDHLPDLYVVVEERDELGPRVAPQPDHCPVFRAPFLLEVVEGGERGVGVGGGVDRFDVPLDRVAIAAGGQAECVSNEMDNARLHNRLWPHGFDHVG
jgi:hypothetical protein